MMVSVVLSVCFGLVLLASCVLCQGINEHNDSSFSQQDRAQLAAILDQLTSLHERIGHIDQRLNSLERHVTEVKTTVNTLLAMQDLHALCSDLNGVTESMTSSRNDVDLPSTTKKPEMPFRIYRVEKSETEDVYKVKVKYEGDTQPITVLRHNSPLREVVDQHLQGVTEFTIPRDPDGNYALLYFILPEQYLTMRLTLNDDSPDSVDIPSIHFNVVQGKDIQFQPGEDVKLNFTFDVGGDNNSVDGVSIQTRVMIRSDSEDKVLERYNDFSYYFAEKPAPVRVDLVEDEISRNYMYGQAVVNSTIENVEGIVEMAYKVRLTCSPHCLVEDVRDVYSVQFYQDDHEGPFPNDFIGFVHDDFRVNNSHFFCEVDEPVCTITCRARGENLTSITITNVTSLDENVHTSEVNLTYGDWAVSRLFITNASFKDAGDFVCTAKSAMGEIKTRITMDVVKRAKIDMGKSHFVDYGNGSFLFVCIANGIPAPEVTFQDRPRNSSEVHVTHPSQSETRADLYVSDPENIYNVHGFYCLASTVRNFIFDRDDSYFLPVV